MKNIVITGPTCSGKTRTAVELAEFLGGEVISADSRQVYRHLDIGTAKPSRDERRRVPHHLIDFLEPHLVYTAAHFRRDAEKKIGEIRLRRGRPVVAGGTGLYIKSLVEGIFSGPGGDAAYRAVLEEKASAEGTGSLHMELTGIDPRRALGIHPNDKRRLIRALEIYRITGSPPSELRKWENTGEEYIIIALAPPRSLLFSSIDSRVERMFSEGFVDEVRKLLDMGFGRDLPSMEAVGYREIMDYLRGGRPLEETKEKIKSATRRYAKRQLTWLRGSRNNLVIESSPGGETETVETIIKFLKTRKNDT